MKARIKSTGVLVDVIPKVNINAQHSGDNLYVCDNMVFRECELDFLNVGNLVIDWEQRRYELAKYNRQTNVYDGRVDDWVSHCECSKLACELDMFDDCDEGLDDDGFIDNLNQYVYDNHYDDKIDDIAKDWQLPRYELVQKVLNELNKK